MPGAEQLLLLRKRGGMDDDVMAFWAETTSMYNIRDRSTPPARTFFSRCLSDAAPSSLPWSSSASPAPPAHARARVIGNGHAWDDVGQLFDITPPARCSSADAQPSVPWPSLASPADITASISSEVTPGRLSPDRMVRVYLKRVTKSVYSSGLGRLLVMICPDTSSCEFVYARTIR